MKYAMCQNQSSVETIFVMAVYRCNRFIQNNFLMKVVIEIIRQIIIFYIVVQNSAS